ncbi:MAG: heterodisulfide reductase-related iron-sulfur binding cluster, partial [Actinomycetota bacterium]|nr:heterodisulfide reductase-related iron-sulfur binding cluster [Actinomycetota bacterium]
KAVSYYGCYLTRPPKVTGAKDPDDPTNMDELVGLTGATPLDWSYKTKCCGGALGATETDISLKMMAEILSDAKRAQADVIVTACPLCQVSLDLRQKAISSRWGEEYNFPILYITQLLGLSFGSDPKELGLHKHITDPMATLKEKGALS